MSSIRKYFESQNKILTKLSNVGNSQNKVAAKKVLHYMSIEISRKCFDHWNKPFKSAIVLKNRMPKHEYSQNYGLKYLTSCCLICILVGRCNWKRCTLGPIHSSSVSWTWNKCDASQQKVPYAGQTYFEILSKIACEI